MKALLRSLTLSGALALGLALGSSDAQAQVQQLRFTTAFAFDAGGRIMPAGTYTVNRTGAQPSVLLLRNEDTRRGALLSVRSDDLPKETPYGSGVQFENRDGKYVLTMLWDSPVAPGSAVPHK
jgi:hypothetical protein